jgi:hypothetical protein
MQRDDSGGGSQVLETQACSLMAEIIFFDFLCASSRDKQPFILIRPVLHAYKAPLADYTHTCDVTCKAQGNRSSNRFTRHYSLRNPESAWSHQSEAARGKSETAACEKWLRPLSRSGVPFTRLCGFWCILICFMQ